MAELPDFLQPHRVKVEKYLGDSAVDDTYAPPVQGIHCHVEGALVVTADGQRAGNVTIRCLLKWADRFLPESRVTLDNGQVGYVQAVARHDDAGAGAWQHLEVAVR